MRLKLESINHEVSVEEARKLFEELSGVFKEQVDTNSDKLKAHLQRVEARLDALAGDRILIGAVKRPPEAYSTLLEGAYAAAMLPIDASKAGL